MINAVGLQNPGIDAVIGEELPRLKTFSASPVIANISGFSVEEYAYCCERIDKEEQVGLIEVNVSCPNVRHGGMSFGTSPEAAAEVTRAVKAVTTKPVYIKLSPNVTDIVAIARACEQAGADGICLINTMLGIIPSDYSRLDILGRDLKTKPNEIKSDLAVISTMPDMMSILLHFRSDVSCLMCIRTGI